MSLAKHNAKVVKILRLTTGLYEKSAKFYVILAEMWSGWWQIGCFCKYLRLETAVLTRERANENEKWVSRHGKGPTKNKNGCPDAGNAQRKIKMGKMNRFKPNEK